MIDLTITSQSWSYTKHSTFADCKRKYMFSYPIAELYRHKRLEGDEFARKVFQLSHLKNIDLLFGRVFHDQVYNAVRAWFREGIVPNPSVMFHSIYSALSEAYQSSTNNRLNWEKRPNEFIMLQELYYGGKIEKEKVERIKEKMQVCVSAFAKSLTTKEICNKDNIKFDQAEQIRRMNLAGVKAVVSVDLAYHNQNNDKKVLVDWKTSASVSMNDYLQLLVYALYFNHVFRIPVEKLELRNEYLFQTKEAERTKTYRITNADIDRIKMLIDESFRNMYEFLLEQELVKVEDVLINVEATTNPKACTNCNYRELCGS